MSGARGKVGLRRCYKCTPEQLLKKDRSEYSFVLRESKFDDIMMYT